MATADESSEDLAADDPRGKGRLDEDPRRHTEGVWRLLEAQPRSYSGGCPKYELCWACGNTGAQGFISRHYCKPSKVQAVPWGPATETYEEADLSWYQGRD